MDPNEYRPGQVRRTYTETAPDPAAVAALPYQGPAPTPGMGGKGGNLTGSNVDAAGRPIRPKWESQIDITSGLLKDPLTSKSPTPTQGLDAFRNEALRTGPSAWRGLMDTQQQQQMGQARDQLGQQQAGQLSQAQNRMAMTGGLSGGASERMGSQMAKQGLKSQQALSMAGQQQGTQYDVADEGKRMGALQQLPGQELAGATFGRQGEQFNIEQALKEQQLKRLAELEAYKSEMGAWGAGKTADAAAAAGAGGGGGLISNFIDSIGLKGEN